MEQELLGLLFVVQRFLLLIPDEGFKLFIPMTDLYRLSIAMYYCSLVNSWVIQPPESSQDIVAIFMPFCHHQHLRSPIHYDKNLHDQSL